MKIIASIKDLRKELEPLRNSKSIGFVPTMGALHEGHLSLVKKCSENYGVTVVSIFVNPTQFNDQNDLKNYPRTLDSDIQLLKTQKVDYLFAPEVEEMYPDGINQTKNTFNFDPIASVLEGKHRPGHFDGVGLIVSKLLHAVEPNSILLGQKDFQQCAIIAMLIDQMNMDCHVDICPISREKNGLARSSRNIKILEEEKNSASAIFESLELIQKNQKQLSPEECLTLAKDFLKKQPICQKLEYLELIDSKTFQPITNWTDSKSIIACVALHSSTVRLIDNLYIIS